MRGPPCPAGVEARRFKNVVADLATTNDMLKETIRHLGQRPFGLVEVEAMPADVVTE